MTKLYIHQKNKIHGLGLAIESKDVMIKEKFINLCYQHFINDKDVKFTLRPFYQSGSNNIKADFHYFEMLGIGRNNIKIDILFNISLKIAKELELELDIE